MSAAYFSFYFLTVFKLPLYSLSMLDPMDEYHYQRLINDSHTFHPTGLAHTFEAWKYAVSVSVIHVLKGPSTSYFRIRMRIISNGLGCL